MGKFVGNVEVYLLISNKVIINFSDIDFPLGFLLC